MKWIFIIILLFLTIEVRSQDVDFINIFLNSDIPINKTGIKPTKIIKILKKKGYKYKITSEEAYFNPTSIQSKHSFNALLIDYAENSEMGYLIIKENAWMWQYSCFIFKKINRKEFLVYKFSFPEIIQNKEELCKRIKLIEKFDLSKYLI